MLSVILSVLPVFILIVIGHAMRRWNFPGDAFWPLADRVVYFVFFPALLVHNLARANLGELDPTGLFGTLYFALLLNALLAFAVKPWLKIDGPSFTSLFQGSVRFNTFVGFGAAAALAGNPGITLYAVVISLAIPTMNVLAVLVLVRYGAHGGGTSLRDQLLLLAKNPLILACLAGILINLSGLRLPPGIDPVFKMLGDVAAPLGLLTVGAALQLDAARQGGKTVVTATLLKLVVYPTTVLIVSRLWGLEHMETQILTLWAMLPTASASYILARQMGGNAPLMAAIVTSSTLGAFITMPIFLALLGL